MAQLLLPLGRREDKSFDSYHATGNEVSVTDLRELGRTGIDSSGNRQLYLWGAPAVGKSHLLQAVCRAVDERGGRSAYIPLAKAVHYDPITVFDNLENFDVLCLDDMDIILSDESWQHELFGLVNTMCTMDGTLVMAGETNPAQLSLSFKDLASRLIWGAVYHLNMPADEDKAIILCSVAKRLGAELPLEVVRYILHNQPRDFTYLVDFVKSLVSTAQQKKCRITIPLVKYVIDVSAEG